LFQLGHDPGVTDLVLFLREGLVTGWGSSAGHGSTFPLGHNRSPCTHRLDGARGARARTGTPTPRGASRRPSWTSCRSRRTSIPSLRRIRGGGGGSGVVVLRGGQDQL